MNQFIRRAVLLTAVLAAPAFAQDSAEHFAAAAGARFQVLSLQAASSGFRPTLSAGMPKLDEQGEAAFLGELRDSASVLAPASFQSAGASQAADLELAPLFNRHLKTTLRFQLGARTVWFSGAFDAGQNPYVSILVDGFGPMYFNVKDLVHNDQHVTFDGAHYTLSLSPNIFHKMKSTINLKNDANSRDAARFSVQDMLDAVSAAGLQVGLAGSAYKFFYAEGVGGGERMYVFIYGGSKDFHVFLIPEKQVPADRMGVFSLFNGQKVGLAHRGTNLQVFENP